jgi:hypothetical protein
MSENIIYFSAKEELTNLLKQISSSEKFDVILKSTSDFKNKTDFTPFV